MFELFVFMLQALEEFWSVRLSHCWFMTSHWCCVSGWVCGLCWWMFHYGCWLASQQNTRCRWGGYLLHWTTKVLSVSFQVDIWAFILIEKEARSSNRYRSRNMTLGHRYWTYTKLLGNTKSELLCVYMCVCLQGWGLMCMVNLLDIPT